MYLSPFKDVGGSRIIFAGLSKVFTQANKKQQRESSHALKSLVNTDILNEPTDYNIEGEFRLDSISKMKTSPLLIPVELRGGDNDGYLSNTTHLISSNASAELARVTVKTEVDLEIKNI